MVQGSHQQDVSQSRSAIVLLSGGLDSTTTLACAKRDGYRLYALTFDYGQKNRVEFVCAEKIAKHFQVVEHRLARIDLRVFGGSSLTSDERVEKDRSLEQIGIGIPRTYVPARNTIFLAYALAWAEVLQATDIYIGVNAVDSSGYPDCRPKFIAAFEEMANYATKLGAGGEQRVRIHTPLIDLSKSEIIKLGQSLAVDYSLTSSCYDPGAEGTACGHCDACILRQRGFYGAGAADPISYVDRMPASKLSAE